MAQKVVSKEHKVKTGSAKKKSSPQEPVKRVPEQDGPPKRSSTMERLLENAAGLFVRKGYAATTTRELSELLGMEKASLYYHMNRKEDLLYEICIETLAEVERCFNEVATEQDPVKRLVAMMHNYVDVSLRERSRHAAMLVEIRSLSEDRRNDVVRRRDANVDKMRSTVAEAMNAGQIRGHYSAKMLTLTLFNLMNWSIFWYQPEGEMSICDIGQMLTDVFLNGVLA